MSLADQVVLGIVFWPVPSRRLGRSLGVNNTPRKPVPILVSIANWAALQIFKSPIGSSTHLQTSCARRGSSMSVPGKLATNAVPMAKALGWNLRGQDRTYPGFFNEAATRIGDHFAGGTGLSETAAQRSRIEPICGHSEVTTQFPIMHEVKRLRIKLVVAPDSRRLIGAQIVSREPVTGRIDLLTFAIQKQATVDDLAELSYSAQPYQSFYPAANGVALAAEDVIAKLSSS